MNPNIKLIRKCEWEEVFLLWYKNEGERDNWNQLARERGFASWADWRLNGYARRFECAQADWGLYEIANPAQTVSGWFGGPFRTWIDLYYGDKTTKIFVDLVSDTTIINQSAVKSMTDDYPKESIISALELSDGRIVVIEGMHRSCALASMTKENKPAPDKLIFAIGKTKLTELPPVGQNTSSK